jgi:hypothetical protein
MLDGGHWPGRWRRTSPASRRNDAAREEWVRTTLEPLLAEQESSGQPMRTFIAANRDRIDAAIDAASA